MNPLGVVFPHLLSEVTRMNPFGVVSPHLPQIFHLQQTAHMTLSRAPGPQIEHHTLHQMFCLAFGECHQNWCNPRTGRKLLCDVNASGNSRFALS